jgi:hypothetical protein
MKTADLKTETFSAYKVGNVRFFSISKKQFEELAVNAQRVLETMFHTDVQCHLHICGDSVWFTGYAGDEKIFETNCTGEAGKLYFDYDFIPPQQREVVVKSLGCA